MSRPYILFFSRGLGRGHAIPDIAIINALRAIRPDLGTTFVSYGTGARTLRDFGQSVIEVNLAEQNDTWENVREMAAVFHTLKERPRLVISHEEFAVPSLADACGLPIVFITDWFVNETNPQMQALRLAQEIVFLDWAGNYDEPSYLAGNVAYVGPVLREMGPIISKRRSRVRLDLPPDASVVLYVPGGAGFYAESQTPAFDLVLTAFDTLQLPEKRLIAVLNDPDYSQLRKITRGRDDILALLPHFDFTSTLVAADLVLTKGNRLPLFESEALGIPSISLSFGINKIDEMRLGQISTNTALRARGVDATALSHYICDALEEGTRQGSLSEARHRAGSAAQRIARHLTRHPEP